MITVQLVWWWHASVWNARVSFQGMKQEALPTAIRQTAHHVTHAYGPNQHLGSMVASRWQQIWPFLPVDNLYFNGIMAQKDNAKHQVGWCASKRREHNLNWQNTTILWKPCPFYFCWVAILDCGSLTTHGPACLVRSCITSENTNPCLEMFLCLF